MKKLIIFALFLLVGCAKGVVAPTAVMPDLATVEFIEIRTTEEFMNIENGLDKSYRLMNDINLSGIKKMVASSSDKSFSGVFDGNGHKIISPPWVFGIVKGGVIMNLTLEDAGWPVVGIIENGTIINVHVSGNIKKRMYGAGIASWLINSVIKNCSSSASVISRGDSKYFIRSGGLVGWMKNSEIIDSYSTGDVIGSEGRKYESVEVGGVVGFAMNSALYNVSSSGDVLYEGRGVYVGGIVGVLESSIIEYAHHSGNVSGFSCVGSIAGFASRSKILNAYSSSAIKSIGATGGIAGTTYRTKFDNISFTGTLIGKNIGDIYGVKSDRYYGWGFTN